MALPDRSKSDRGLFVSSGERAGMPALVDCSESDYDDIEQRASLFRAVRELPEDQRRVIELRFVEQKSIREVAEALERSEGAIKQLQFRGLEALRTRMGEHHG